MGTVHQLLTAKGKQGALELGHDRQEVEAAAAYLSDEDAGGVGFLYSGWCQAALPHRRLPDGEGWQIQSERTTLIVEPGMRPGLAKPVPIGVPYGSRARLILIFLQSEAIRTKSREIELGSSLRAWLTRLGIPQGGTSIAAVRDQAERLSLCRLTFRVQSGNSVGLVNQSIVDTALFLDDQPEGQGALFMERARLSEGFYAQLQQHPVPLEESAIRAVSNNSQALDIYAWLAYRLHSLPSHRPVSWHALRPQFGASFGRLDNFRARFLPNLRLALAVYPAAHVEVTDAGLVLHPSRPPVAPRAAIR
jgi:hypothetical protein